MFFMTTYNVWVAILHRAKPVNRCNSNRQIRQIYRTTEKRLSRHGKHKLLFNKNDELLFTFFKYSDCRKTLNPIGAKNRSTFKNSSFAHMFTSTQDVRKVNQPLRMAKFAHIFTSTSDAKVHQFLKMAKLAHMFTSTSGAKGKSTF